MNDCENTFSNDIKRPYIIRSFRRSNIRKKIAEYLEKLLVFRQEYPAFMGMVLSAIIIFSIISIWTFISGFFSTGVIFLIFSLLFLLGFYIWLQTGYKKDIQERVIYNGN